MKLLQHSTRMVLSISTNCSKKNSSVQSVVYGVATSKDPECNFKKIQLPLMFSCERGIDKVTEETYRSSVGEIPEAFGCDVSRGFDIDYQIKPFASKKIPDPKEMANSGKASSCYNYGGNTANSTHKMNARCRCLGEMVRVTDGQKVKNFNAVFEASLYTCNVDDPEQTEEDLKNLVQHNLLVNRDYKVNKDDLQCDYDLMDYSK